MQACIPDRLLLPVAVQRIVPGSGRGPWQVSAREIHHAGDLFVYDLVAWPSDDGAPEIWSGLQLRSVRSGASRATLPSATLVPLLERSVDGVAFSLSVGDQSREVRAREALGRITGSGTEILRRSDGRPEAIDGVSISGPSIPGPSISVAHTPLHTLAASSHLGRVGCDLEHVGGRADDAWRDVLGVSHFALAESISRAADEPLDVSATRVWTAIESLKKAGQSDGAPVLLDTVVDGRLTLRAGSAAVTSLVLQLLDNPRPLAVGVATLAVV